MRHEVPLLYFKRTNCFHTIFGVSNPKYLIHARIAIQLVFPNLSYEYANDYQYDPVLFLNKLIYQQRILD